jgi:hypothetical protein
MKRADARPMIVWVATDTPANLTHEGGLEFLCLAPKMVVVTQSGRCPLQWANHALSDLRAELFERG